MKRILIGIAVGLGFAGAALAADTRYLPPPGLYKVDIVGGLKVQSPTHTLERNDTYDGASGSISSEYKRDGGSPAKNVIPGAGPHRTCIGPTAPGALPKGLPSMDARPPRARSSMARWWRCTPARGGA